MISSLHLTYGVVSEAKSSELVCGDRWFVKEFSDAMLVAVIDGLGHGEYAAEAAKKIIEVLEMSQENENLSDIVKHCHMSLQVSLQGSRGAVMILAKIQKNYQVTWVSIGNIVGLHWQAKNQKKEILLAQGGVVGFKMPKVRSENFTAHPGDLFILATDGLQSDFVLEDFYFASPQATANALFKKYRKRQDDALVLVLSWGESDE